MPSPYAYTVYTSTTSGQTDFQFTWPYIKEEHVKLYVNYNEISQGSGSSQFQVITNVSPKLVRLNTGLGSANLRVEVRRISSLDTPLVDYADGSTLTATDLDTSSLQSLYIAQELDDNQSRNVAIDTSTALPSLNNQRLTNVSNPTAAQDAATKNYVDTKQFTSAQIQDGTLVNADVNASAAIDGTKISPNFGSQNIVTSGTVDGRDVSVDGAKLDGIETGATADQTNAEIRAAVEAASDSNVFTDADHSKLNAIEAGATADQTNAEIRAAVEAASDSNVFTDADHTKLNSVESGATADQTITEIKNLIASSPLDASHLAANSVTTSEIADAELTTLAGMQSDTASILASSTALTATNAEINTVCDGKSVQTTISDTDNSYPTSGAVVDYVAAQIAPLGGLEVIANEDSFPTQPASGVVISIADAGGIVVNGSGVSTTARTSGNGSDNVTINGFPSSLHSTTLSANLGLMVSSTGSNNTYTYHKLLGKEDDIKQLSDDINDFNSRYRVAASAPSSSLDDGDLWFDTTNDKMKVYNATSSSWDDVASVGDFFINTLSSSSNTGGGSATFNGTAYRFVLSNPPSSAQQLIVSVNGVIQKPNAGSSQPSEGFAVSGNDIIFSAAPPSGADYFITTQGSAVSVGTPSDNTVSTAKLQNLAVTGDKIANDTITEVKLDIHQAPSDGKFLKYTSSNGMEWGDVPTGVGGATGVDFNDNVKARFGTGNDLNLWHNGTNSFIQNDGGSLYIGGNTGAANTYIRSNDGEVNIACIKNGAVELYEDNVKTFETTSSGIRVLGPEGGAGEVAIYADEGDDNADKWKLKMDGSNVFRIQNYASGSWENAINAVGDGTVEVCYDGTKKFETTSDGATVTGHLKSYHLKPLGNDAYDVGTSSLRWRDGYFSDGIDLSDSGKLKLGSGDDLQIYHDGTSGIIDNNTGDLFIKTTGSGDDILLDSNDDIFLRVAGTESGIEIVGDGGCALYWDSSKKLETFANGIKLYDTDGTQIGEGFDGGFNFTSLVFVDELRLLDSEKIKLGLGGDLELFHDGSHNYIVGSTGDIILKNSTANYFKGVTSTGAVELYYNSTKRAYTTAHGFEGYKSTTCLGRIGTSNSGHYFESQSDDTTHGFEIYQKHGSNTSRASLAVYDNRTGSKSLAFYVRGDGETFSHPNDLSDRALKDNITDMATSYTKIKNLRPVNFTWKNRVDTEGNPVSKSISGFIAQEVEEQIPNIINGEEGGKGINSAGLVAHLTKALQEAITKIETLETKVAALESA